MVSLIIFNVNLHQINNNIISILFLVIHFVTPFVTPLTFNFTSFTPNDVNIIYERAYPSNNVIQLTTNQRDLSTTTKLSGNLTNFNTNFTFVINSLNQSRYGDGIAFFLAPNGSRIPENTTRGGSMGLTADSDPLNSTNNPFVAVEFDTFTNFFDPPNEHVGIDINSMRSVANVTWWSSVSIMEGRMVDVWISYDSQSNNLSVVFTGLVNRTYVRQRLSNVVDLRDHLPEYVTFGFSAATGSLSALHNIYSWSFSSNLELHGNGTNRGTITPDSNPRAISRNSRGEYASEVKIISRLRHRNLVQLLGWCHEKKELVLVYEFMPNGSLDYHLIRGKSSLDWGKRLKIAQGLASSLLYLHEEWEQCVIHRDIKSSNVMLDANFNAKLGDFGLARLVDHEKEAQTTILAGTLGYMAPECAITGKASKETDVFSYGVVALEIASGRRPINRKAKQSDVNLVEWIWSLYGMEKLLEAGDPQLGEDFNEEEMERLMIVGLWCAHPDSNLRPTIRQAILVLNCEAPLPILPSRMPVATYCTMPMVSSSNGDIVFGSSQTLSSVNTGNTESSKFTASSEASSPSASLLNSR
ncbi:hypothetical protein ACJIZ3_001204 [Penstemon smallii]|uniref:non-specific serine/threonine protein kinase n=1 Tax=Penstemon smallii TaxID=265156 RepID=A0ABD3U2Y8_9LAMI